MQIFLFHMGVTLGIKSSDMQGIKNREYISEKKLFLANFPEGKGKRKQV